MRVLIHVQHLLGIGHLQRSALIARALAAAGAGVTLVSGGMPWPGLEIGGARFVQLPPLRAGPGGFTDLIGTDGRTLGEAGRAERRQLVLAALDAADPDALLIETYPFGRRALRFELEPLVAAARGRRRRPVIACSIRDIVAAKPDPARRAAIVGTLRASFDRLLVHADPRFIRLDESFPEAPALADMLCYTGFVAPAAPPPAAPSGEILVSAGGGAAGAALLKTAKAARDLSRHRGRTWRLIAGRNLPEEEFSALAQDLPPGLVLDRHRADFHALLSGAAVSVSQAGYNTVAEVLQARVPAVFVPFAGGGETEQTMRAERLQVLGLAVTAAEAALTPHGLAAAIDRAADPAAHGFDFDGARRSAALLFALAVGRRL